MQRDIYAASEPSSDDYLERAAPDQPSTLATVETLNPDRYFTDGKFEPTALAAVLIDRLHPKRGADGRLWIYADGVYVPDNKERACRAFIVEQLGVRWRQFHTSSVISFLDALPVTIGDVQPSDLINVRNGLLEWRTGELRPHNPSVVSTIQHPVVYDPAATCPKIEQFLGEVLEPQLRAFALEIIAYAIMPLGNPYQRAVMLLGPGGNGKSVFLNLIRALVGDDHTASVSLHNLVGNRFFSAELYGKAVNICGDLDARSVTRSDVFKQVTGSDVVQAERKGRDPFTFVPQAVSYFSANQAPHSRDQSAGYFDRWLILPFEVRVRGTRAEDPHLSEKLHRPSELSGLLNLLLPVMQQLHQRGNFRVPDKVKAAGKRYRVEHDSALSFISDECEFDADGWVDRARLYKSYRSWCEDEGIHALARRNFYEHLRRLEEPLLLPRKRQGLHGFLGLRHPYA